MVTVNYDDLLRDIQLWVYDLDGAAGDVNKALVEARRNRSEIEERMAAANPDDAQGLHDLLWYSEQYPLVEQRLADIGAQVGSPAFHPAARTCVPGVSAGTTVPLPLFQQAHAMSAATALHALHALFTSALPYLGLCWQVAPVNDAVKALRDLHDFIRQDTPPLADAESIRDAVIAKLFEDLSRQGLDAHHPFAAYGGNEAAPEPSTSAAPERQPNRLRSLLSLGKRSRKAANTRGGDLRTMVQQMIEEATRIPPPPPLPVDYSGLLADLRRWIEALHGVKRDVQEAIEDAHDKVEDNHDVVAGANPEDQQEWHRLMWFNQELPAIAARLRGVQEQVEPPTQEAAQALQDFIQHIEIDKPLLAEAESMRGAAISKLAQRLARQGLPPLPPNPQPEEVRTLAARAIEDARRLPDMPPFVDYSELLADLQRWIAELEGAAADVDQAQAESRQQTSSNSGLLSQLDKVADPEGWWRLNWLSEQYPTVEARLAVVADETSAARSAAATLRDLRHAIEDQYQAALVKPPLAELEGVRDRALDGMAEEMGRYGLDAQAAIAASAGGASSSSGAAGVRGMVQGMIEEARRLPPVPPMPVDYSGLLASVHRWIEELQGAAEDVEQAQAEASRDHSNVVAQLAAAALPGDPTGWHRLTWLGQELPLLAGRLRGVAGKAAPGGAAVQELQQLAQRIESEKPPLAEATAARDAAVTSLLASLGQQGLAVPAGASPSDVRGSVQRAIEDARRLPEMPAFLDYSALLADLQQWVEELQAAAADVAAAQQEASAATADAGSQLAATAAADKESLHRLGWLTEQLPLAEQRLAAVSSGLDGPAAAATAALQQLRQRVEQDCVPALVKPPVAELEAERDAAVAALAAELAQRDLPAVPELPSTADVRGAVWQAIEEARRLPAMPLIPVDYSALLADIQGWIAALEAASADVSAAQQEVSTATADTAAAAAAADPTDLPALHRLAWLSKETPLVEERVEGVAAKLAPAGEAVEALQQLVKRIEQEQPPLENATAARNQAVTVLLDGLAAGGLLAQEAAGVRSAVQQAIEDARRLPEMPAFVDYSELLADLQRWAEVLAAATAEVSAARQAAAAATADASSQLEAADRSDGPATFRLLWLSEQLPLVEQRLAAVGEQLAPAAAASDTLQQLRQRVEEECVPALIKPPLAELEAERDAALSAMAAELSSRDLPAVPALPSTDEVQSAVQQAVEDAKRLPEMPPFVDYSELLADIQSWVEALETATADVGTAQQEAAHARERTTAEMVAADKGDRESWHCLLWLSEQQPLAEARLAAVGTQAGPLAAAAAGLQELAQTIEQEHAVSLAQPPLEEMEAVLDALLASMAEQLDQQGLAGVVRTKVLW
jgi:exonuclease VII small subunit